MVFFRIFTITITKTSKKYNKLNNAIKNALSNNSTSGITMSKKIKKYTLRRGINLLNSPSGEVSWLKNKEYKKKIDNPKIKKNKI